MKIINEALKKYISNLHGLKLEHVVALIYVLEAPDLESPQQLQFVFSSECKFLGFRCGHDGASIEIFNSPLQENDLGEYGKEVIMELSGLDVFRAYIGKRFVNFYFVFSEVEKKNIGVKLEFEGGGDIVILNIGDEMVFSNSLAPDFEREESISYVYMPR